MKRRDLVALLAMLAAGIVAAPVGGGAGPHGYYLFLADPARSCEDCYVPLLVVPQSLEDVASSGRDTTSVLVTTYERDSIWKVERGVPLAAADILARERMVRVGGRRYRFQEVAPAEVLQLLEKPGGTIPIHRVTPVPDPTSLEDLLAAFRGQR
jgi:hypothetical protein